MNRLFNYTILLGLSIFFQSLQAQDLSEISFTNNEDTQWMIQQLGKPVSPDIENEFKKRFSLDKANSELREKGSAKELGKYYAIEGSTEFNGVSLTYRLTSSFGETVYSQVIVKLSDEDHLQNTISINGKVKPEEVESFFNSFSDVVSYQDVSEPYYFHQSYVLPLQKLRILCDFGKNHKEKLSFVRINYGEAQALEAMYNIQSILAHDQLDTICYRNSDFFRKNLFILDKGVLIEGFEDPNGIQKIHYGYFVYVGRTKNGVPHDLSGKAYLGILRDHKNCRKYDDHEKRYIGVFKNGKAEGKFKMSYSSASDFEKVHATYGFEEGFLVHAENLDLGAPEKEGFVKGLRYFGPLKDGEPHGEGQVAMVCRADPIGGDYQKLFGTVVFNHGTLDTTRSYVFHRYTEVEDGSGSPLNIKIGDLAYKGKLSNTFAPKGEGTIYYYTEGRSIYIEAWFDDGWHDLEQPLSVVVSVDTLQGHLKFSGLFSRLDVKRMRFGGDEITMTVIEDPGKRMIGAYKYNNTPMEKIGVHKTQYKENGVWVTKETKDHGTKPDYKYEPPENLNDGDVDFFEGFRFFGIFGL